MLDLQARGGGKEAREAFDVVGANRRDNRHGGEFRIAQNELRAITVIKL